MSRISYAFGFSIVISSGLLGLQASATDSCQQPNNDKVNGSQYIVNQIASSLGKPALRGRVRLNSEAKESKGVQELNVHTHAPLFRAIDVDIVSGASKAPNKKDGSYYVRVGDPNVIIYLDSQKNPSHDITASLSFKEYMKDGKGRFIKDANGNYPLQTAPLRVDLLSKDKSQMRWQINSLQLKGSGLLTDDSEIKLTGGCDLAQEYVNYVPSGPKGRLKAVTNWNKTLCTYTLRWDKKCGRFNYDIIYDNLGEAETNPSPDIVASTGENSDGAMVDGQQISNEH